MNEISKQADGLGTQLRRLLELLDGDVEAVYKEHVPGYVPRYTPIMKALEDGEAKTIKEIAAQSSVSHSAASQTVSKMVSIGLIKSSVDEDSRYRRVSLTASGRRLLPELKKFWAATDQAARHLDRSLRHPLGALIQEAITSLESKPFRARIESQLSKKSKNKE